MNSLVLQHKIEFTAVYSHTVSICKI